MLSGQMSPDRIALPSSARRGQIASEKGTDYVDRKVPDPAVSVPSAKLARPAATAAAEPEDDPPGTKRSSKALGGVP